MFLVFHFLLCIQTENILWKGNSRSAKNAQVIHPSLYSSLLLFDSYCVTGDATTGLDKEVDW